MPYVKLQTNVPLFGVPKYADRVEKEGEYGLQVQLKLKGTWEGHDGPQDVYLPEACIEQAEKLGVITWDGDKAKVVGSPRLKILKTEDGNKKRTTITLEGQASASSSAPSRNGSAPASAGGRTQGERQPPAIVFRQLVTTLGRCAEEGAKIAAAAKLDGEAARTFGVTLFIQCCQMGALAPAPKPVAADDTPPTPLTDAQKHEIDELAARLGWEVAKIEREICTATGATDAYHLTQPQAVKAIARLKGSVAAEEAKREAERRNAAEEIPF